MNVAFNMDCMEAMKEMKEMKDNQFDLAIVDPPYGIGDFVQSDRQREKKVVWNETPPQSDYFEEINRVSKNQIIWGANYYNCFSPTGGAIIWDKIQMHPQMSRYEIASCSMQKRTTGFVLNFQGAMRKHEKNHRTIHPCQKPIKLYEWLLKNYAKKGDSILDTHLGSGSSRIAAYNFRL